MAAFWISFALIFLAELGDKTQLVALAFATRYNAKIVLTSILAATVLVHAFSVGLGELAKGFLPTNWIHFAAGIAFIGFALWTLRGDSLDDDDNPRFRAIKSPFWIVAVTFFLAELGDKTMLSTVTLAAEHSWWSVWLGSTAGMVISDGIAIWIGKVLGARLPEKIIKLGASLIFLAFGVFGVIEGGTRLPFYAWGAGVIGLALLVFFFRPQLPKIRRFKIHSSAIGELKKE